MGLEQVFDNLTFKHMDALRKQIQSLVQSTFYCSALHLTFNDEIFSLEFRNYCDHMFE